MSKCDYKSHNLFTLPCYTILSKSMTFVDVELESWDKHRTAQVHRNLGCFMTVAIWWCKTISLLKVLLCCSF